MSARTTFDRFTRAAQAALLLARGERLTATRLQRLFDLSRAQATRDLRDLEYALPYARRADGALHLPRTPDR
jgi:predicted DNA-binding transcriptional regulator YafY